MQLTVFRFTKDKLSMRSPNTKKYGSSTAWVKYVCSVLAFFGGLYVYAKPKVAKG